MPYRSLCDGKVHARAVPSAFLFVGCANPDAFESMPLHSARFQLDERVLGNTAAVFSQAALQLLAEP